MKDEEIKKRIKESVLDKVKTGKITQKSKWYFLTKTYTFWFFAAAATILGAFSFSSIIFQVSEFGEFLKVRTEHLAESI